MVTRARTWLLASVAASLLGAALLVASAPPAVAACHRFTIEASPTRVSEGATVKVTVTRDAAVAPSSIDVETIDDTATAGQDFTKVDRTIAFTGNDVEETFDIPITNDSAAEPDETFKLHLSNPAGCPPNTNFDVGDDVDVTIAASDTPGATAVAPTQAAPATTARPPVTPAPTSTSVPDVIVEDTNDDDDGVSDGAIIAAIVVALEIGRAHV